MISLKVGNSFSKIEGLTQGQFKELRELLSYRVEGNFFAGKHHSDKRYLINARGDFPTGLLSKVNNYLDKLTLAYKQLEERVCPKYTLDFKLSLPFEPRLKQTEAVKAAIHHERGTISMVTGYGKSAVIALLIATLKVRTLVVVPNLGLKSQLQSFLKESFGSLDNIRVENIDSPSLGAARDYDCLIIDESHHVAARTYRELNKKAWTGIFYRFFLTGTPFRSNTEENMLMESISGDLIYNVGYKEALAEGAIVPIEAYYVTLPRRRVNSSTYAGVYSELVVNRHDRNEWIADRMIGLFTGSKSTLCLVKEIAHGENIKTICNVAFTHGSDTEKYDLISWFNKGQLTCLIGTNGVLGEGVDTKPAEYIIIAGLGKSKNQFMQQVGRGLRTYPGKSSAKIIFFFDPSHKWTRSHFREQCQILRQEYGIEPQPL